MSLHLPETGQSLCLHDNKKNVLSCKVTVNWMSGGLQFYLSNQGTISTPPSTWEEVTLTSGTETTHTFTATGTTLYWKFIKDSTTVVYALSNSLNEWTTPGIRIRSIVTEE